MTGYHARKSPSKAKRLHGCAGAIAAEDALPAEMRTESTEAARKGTCAHFLLERCLSDAVPPAAFEDRLIQIVVHKDTGAETGCSMLRMGAKMPKAPDARARTFVVDAQMMGDVDLAYTYVVQRCEALDIDPKDRKALQLETRTNPVPDRDDTDGTADVSLDAWPLLLEVVDYKNGRLTVEHEDNPQLLAYLAGRAHDTGWCHDEYIITVIQPNGRHDEGKIRSFPITADKLRAFVDKHRAAAERSDEAALAFDAVGHDMHQVVQPVRINERGFEASWADTYLAAGDHCDFCDVWSVCPAFKQRKQEQAGAEFDDTPDEYAEKNPLHVESVETARGILEKAPHMRALISAATRLVTHEAKAGRLPEGLKWVRGRSIRKLRPDEDGEPIPPQVLAARIVAEGFFNANEKARLFEPEALLTGPKILQLLPAKKRAEFEEAFLHKPPGKLKLVPVDEPGEAVTVTVGDDFEDEPDELEEDHGY